MTLTELGRLFQLKLKHNRRARLDALATIREVSRGSLRPHGWSVRVGGAVRGATLVLPTRADAERAVHDYYNQHL